MVSKALRTFTGICLLYCLPLLAFSQPFVDACFNSPAVGPSFAGTASITNSDSDLLRWTGSNWTGYWALANVTLTPPGATVGMRAIWSGDGTVWTTGGEGFGLRLSTPTVSGTTYTFAFHRVSHGYGQDGSFAPALYTNTGGTYGTLYGNIPSVGTTWTNSNISFTATVSGHTFVYFHNTSGSGMFLGCTTAILPMAFSGLRAYPADAAIDLEWQVQDETNYVWHVVERATDGKTFDEVGRVPSVKAGPEGHRYVFRDADPALAPAVGYQYRIRSLDQDGLETFSPVVEAKLAATSSFFVEVAPNPVVSGNAVGISYFAEENGVGEWQVTDVQGRLIFRGIVDAESGKNQFEVPTDRLSPGCYQIRLRMGQKAGNARIVVQ